MRYFIFAALMVLAGTVLAEAEVQTDWQGGPGVAGPVTDWGDTFYVADDMDWDTEPGQLKLIVDRSENEVATTNGPMYVQAVDMDLDGDLDIACCGYNSGQVFWARNNNGQGTSWTKVIIGNIANPRFIAVGDFDGNGLRDIVASSDAENKIVLFRFLSSGGWTPSTTIAENFDARQIRAVDVDQDGNLDVVGVSSYSGDVCWWKNDGTSTSWNQNYIDGALVGAYCCAVGDFNADGHPDVVAASNSADDICAYLSQAPYGYSWDKTTIASSYNNPVAIAVADFNADGVDDFAVASSSGSGNLRWYDYLDTDDSWVSHSMSGAAAVNIYDIDTQDMDGDGYADIIAASYGENRIVWCKNREYLGDPWETFAVSTFFAGALGVSTGDMDDDTVPDVLACAFTGDQVSWWRVSGFTAPSMLTSSILNVEPPDPNLLEWDYIHWSKTTPDGTSVMFRLKTSYDAGSMGTWSAWITSPSDLSSVVTQGGSFVQYQVRLDTSNPNITPSLKDVTVIWDPVSVEGETGAAIDGRLVWVDAGNPVSGPFSVGYNVMQAGRVTVDIYDSAGRIVHEIAGGEMDPGTYSAAVQELPAGIYAIVMETAEGMAAQRVTVIP